MTCALSDADVVRLVHAFRLTSSTELDLCVGTTKLRLGGLRVESSVERVTAPVVGIFQADAALGDAVQSDSILGRIKSVQAETLVHARRAGVITKMIAMDGEFVEYSAPLAEVRFAVG
jgi:biotin carboxyl carrier protein